MNILVRLPTNSYVWRGAIVERRNRKVTIIPAIVSPNRRKVAIYCRVSTQEDSQQNSLKNQVEGLKEIVRQNKDWALVRVYEDIQSGGSIYRPYFEQMMMDAYDYDFDLILVKSVSRFSRNQIYFLTTINKFDEFKIEVIFNNDNIKSTDPKQKVMMEIKGIFAEEESSAISQNIKSGQYKLMKSGDSKLYRRKCYGYTHDIYGGLVVEENEVVIVGQIFN